MYAIKAISFDLWDTVFVDDSDEPKRRSAGLPSKAVARRQLLHEALVKHAPCERILSDCAYDAVDAAFRHVWHQQHVTWTVRDRLALILRGLGRDLPEAELQTLVDKYERMEIDFKPDLADGIRAAIVALAQQYTLLVISDAIFSPGWALREILRAYELDTFFSYAVFSDELGCSKPAKKVFSHAADLAACSPSELLHIGDREQNDILGPQSVGARAILSTVVIDRDSANTKANAVCQNYNTLANIVTTLNGG